MAEKFIGPSEEDEAAQAKWSRSGECLQCGKCCNSIVTSLQYSPELDDYLEWMSMHTGVEVNHDTDTGKVYVKFANKCRCLRFRGGKAECSYYFSNRPKICQNFPSNPDAGASCKGYTFTVAKPDIPEEPPVEEAPEPTPPEDSSKLVPEREGECLRCGKCCKTIVTTLTYREELQDYLEWVSLHQGVLVRHDKGTGVVEVEFQTKCRALRYKRGKASCRIYDKRPTICKKFPLTPLPGQRCPGFTFTFRDPAEAP